ncbi:MAG: hypothetical protein KBC36_11920 [Spirochaetia bacterium]|nr:hypothetical protein [Spirochaetia bacterium]
MMDRKRIVRIGTSPARRVLALVFALLSAGSLACAQTAPAKGSWKLEGGRLSTAGFTLAFGSTSAEAEALLGKPAYIEPWPFSFSWQYAGFLSLDFDDGTSRLSGVRLYLEKGIEGKGVSTKIPLELAKVEVFGLVVDDASTWAGIEKLARERGVKIVAATPGEELGLSDGKYEAWFYCEKDQGGDLHSVEYFKRQ